MINQWLSHWFFLRHCCSKPGLHPRFWLNFWNICSTFPSAFPTSHAASHGDQPTTCSQWLLTGGSNNDITWNFSSSVIDSTGLSDSCTVLSFLPSLPSFSVESFQVNTLFSMSKSQVAAGFYRRPRDRVTQQARDLPNRLDFMQEKGTQFCDDFFCSGWESSHPLGFWSHISVAWFSNNNNNNNNNNVWMEENLRCWQVWRMFLDWLVKMWNIRFLASFARHVLGMFACFLLAYSLSIYPKPPIVQVTDWFGESLGNATWAQIVMQWKAVDVLNAYPTTSETYTTDCFNHLHSISYIHFCYMFQIFEDGTWSSRLRLFFSSS